MDDITPESQITGSRINSNVANVKLEDELKQAFIDYAMSVIVDRALPDVRDGLKPVHRRVLYDMYDLKIWNSGQTKKSARVVGDVIGRFHPHGDAAVYETIVRMAQWFSMREPLIFGQGNFGNIDGDGAAAMRYTEIKMTKIAEAMLDDIDKETVNTYDNYDGNEQIPEVLPTRFPNLLVNGSSGIAVGMATNIPPHNLGEVIDGSIQLLNNPDMTLDEIMQYIPGPDFPTGGYIVGNAGIKEAYATGRGKCVMRARTHMETDRDGRRTIYVDEIPYTVRKTDIVKQIVDLMREKKIEGISEVNDLSDKDNLVRIAIDLKRDAYEAAVLNNLYDKTRMEESFGINMVALVGNNPRQLSLLEILREFLDFRREVVTRRTVYLLRQDRRKAFLNEGLIVAKSNIRQIVDMITNSSNADDARNRLISEPWDGALISGLIARAEDGSNICLPQGIEERAGLHGGKYFLSEEQAKAILSMQLQRLTHMASDEIQKDYKGLIENIRGYLRILNDREVMNQVIRDELTEIKNQYDSKRRSEFTEDLGKASKKDYVAKQDVVVTLSEEGYIKYQDLASYESQKRGGKGRMVAKLKDEDYINKVVVANTHDCLICFTDRGRCFVRKVFDLPTSDNRTWKGRPVQNFFNIEEGEIITALLPVPDKEDRDGEEGFNESYKYVFMATAKGMVKKIALSQLDAFLKRDNNNAIKVFKLADDDLLIGVELTSGDDDIVLFSSQGKAIRFCEFYQKRGGDDEAAEDEEAAEQAEAPEEGESGEEGAENGEFDRHRGSGVRESGRAAGGIRGIRLPGGAKVVSMFAVPESEVAETNFLIASANGFGKLMKTSEIAFRNRGSQGVIVMKNLERNGTVIGAGIVDDSSEFILITDQGQMIRSPVSGIQLYGRYSAGVILMRPSEGESVIALQTLSEDIVEATKKQALARRHDRMEERLKDQGIVPGSQAASAQPVGSEAGQDGEDETAGDDAGGGEDKQ